QISPSDSATYVLADRRLKVGVPAPPAVEPGGAPAEAEVSSHKDVGGNADGPVMGISDVKTKETSDPEAETNLALEIGIKKQSWLKGLRRHRTTQISRVHRSRLLRRRPAGCSGGTSTAFAAVSVLKKPIGTMTRLFQSCVACVRIRRSHTDNLRRILPWFCIFVFAAAAEAQVQVDLKF